MHLTANGNPSGFKKIIVLLIIVSAAALLAAPASADTGVTIAARGDQSYYYGEEVVLGGYNYDTATTYLSVTGPNLPAEGGSLTSPHINATSGDAGSFTAVPVNPDKTWKYTWYTSGLMLDAGVYTIGATGLPRTDVSSNGTQSGRVSIIIKRPFITADVAPASVSQGQPFTIAGYAEGDPAAIQVWIVGDAYLYNATIPVRADSNYTFQVDAKLAGTIPSGPVYVIVQHPMQNNQLGLVVAGDWVTNQEQVSGSPDAGTNLFRIRGPGSLQGNDAKESIVAALDVSGVDDTYAIVPLIVEGDAATSAPLAQPTTNAPVQRQTQSSPLVVAPIGAIVLIVGIAGWRRQ